MVGNLYHLCACAQEAQASGGSALVAVLNASNMVVSKRTMGSSAIVELGVDLASDSEPRPALCAPTLIKHIDLNYREAVRCMDNCLSDTGNLADADVQYFKDRMQDSEQLLSLIPMFGINEQDIHDQSAFINYLNRQAERLEQLVMQCDLAGSDLGSMDFASQIAGKLLDLHRSFRLQNPHQYADLQKVIYCKIYSSVEDARCALEQNKYDIVASNILDLAMAGTSKISMHFPSGCLSISTMSQQVIEETKKHFQVLADKGAELLDRVKAKIPSESKDLEDLRSIFDNFMIAQATDWKGHVDKSLVETNFYRVQNGVSEYLENLTSSVNLKQSGGLGHAHDVHQQMVALRSLPGMEAKTNATLLRFSTQVLDASLLACAEIEKLMNDASAYAASLSKGSTKDARPNLEKVPAIVNDLVSAEWVEACREGAYRQSVEKSQGIIIRTANTMLNLAKDSVSELTVEGLQATCFIFEQFDFFSRIDGNVMPSLQAGKQDLFNVLEQAVAKLEGKLKLLFPWKEVGSCVSSTQKPQSSTLGIDTAESEQLFNLTNELESFLQNRSGVESLTPRVKSLSSTFKESIQDVIAGLKVELEKCLSSIQETEGIIEIQNEDVLLPCLKEALLFKKYDKIMALYKGPDFITETVRQLQGYYEKLSIALESSLKNLEVGRMEKLLKTVRLLCLLDEVSTDTSRKFSSLYQTYEGKLSGNLVQGEKFILECLACSNLKKAAEQIPILFPDGQVSWKIKSELSSKISDMIESIEGKLRLLAKDLPTQAIKAIYDEWLALASGQTAVMYASDSVKNDYKQVIIDNDGAPGAGAVIVRKSIRLVLKQKLKSFTSEYEDLLSAGRYQKAANLLQRVEELTDFESMFGLEFSGLSESLNSKLKTSVEKRVAEFKDVKLEDYFHNPPSHFFQLFEVNSEEQSTDKTCNVASMFKDQIEAVWKSIEKRIRDHMDSADLGRGSKDTEILERAIDSLPDCARKSGLQQLLLKAKESADGKRKEFEGAVCDRNVQQIMDFVSSCQPCLQAEYLSKLEAVIKGIIDEICSSLEKFPCQVQFDSALLAKLKFVAELKLFAGMPDKFASKAAGMLQSLKKSLESAESDARSNIISLLSLGRKSTVDARFPTVDDTFGFLARLVTLRSDSRRGSLANSSEFLPQNFGQFTLEAFQFVYNDYNAQLKILDGLLQSEPVDKPFDTVKIVSTLKTIWDRTDMYSKAKGGLVKLSDLGGSDSAVIDQEEEPRKTVMGRIRNFAIENFQVQPELNKKIALSSERTRAFQLLGKRVVADSCVSGLFDFIRDDKEVSDLLKGGFTAKVQTAGRQLWSETTKLFEDLTTDAQPGKYRDDGYSANADPELERQRKTCEQLNVLHDHLELFQQHVCPTLPPGAVSFDLPGLASNLLDKMGKIADQICSVSSDDLDGAAGVLVCLQIRYQELLFQRSECKRVVEKCLEKYQATSAGKGTGISKLGFKLAGSKFRPFGEQIVQSYDAFQGYRAKAFREKTARYKEDYVLKEMKCTNQDGRNIVLNNGQLLDMFKEFDKEYKEIVDRCLREGFGDAAESFVIQRLRAKVQKLRLDDTPDAINWTPEMRSAVPTMVAQIFAVWTFHHSKRFLSAMDGEDKESFLFMPHPVQIIAIFCMLGLDNPGTGRGNCDIDRSLVQVTSRASF